MDAMLHALGEILLRAVPTFLLVILLNIYLKFVFFKPLHKVLERRYDATEGARKLAEQSLERATQKTAQYEAALQAARSDVYRAAEKLYRELQDREAADLAEARQRADAAVRAAKADLEKDVESAKAGLARESEALAEQIAQSILRRSVA